MRVPEHVRTVLGNGVTLVVIPGHDVPLVAFNATLRGGAACDARSNTGVASLAAGLLEKGAGRRNAFEFVDAVEGVGGTFNAGAGPESIAIRGQFLSRDQRLMMELLGDALLAPRLDLESFETLRARQVELIKAAKDSDPSELLGTYGRAFLFADHPFGQPVMGSEASLERIVHRDVTGYYDRHFGADHLTLVIGGDVDPDCIRAAVTERFADWRASVVAPQALPPPQRLTSRRVLLVDAPGSTQAHFWIGNVGIARGAPERAAVDLVNTLFGGRFTSFLNTELRVKSGLSYGARSGFTRGSVAGEFAIRSFVQTDKALEAIELALRSLLHLKQAGISEPQLESARAYLLGQFPLDFETIADWTLAMGEVELYRLGSGYVENYGAQLAAVTFEQARSAIDSAFPAPEAVAIVVIGDGDALHRRLEALGSVTRMELAHPDFDCRATSGLGSRALRSRRPRVRHLASR